MPEGHVPLGSIKPAPFSPDKPKCAGFTRQVQGSSSTVLPTAQPGWGF